MHFPASVQRRLKNYVYVYSDPETGRPIYIGVGKSNRVFDHLREEVSDSRKSRKIQTLLRRGKKPRIDILVHGLKSRELAERIEAAAIDLVGKKRLLNENRGLRSFDYGRMPVRQVMARYSPHRAVIKTPSILIRINQLYRYDMTPRELYEVTRGIWKVGPRREKAKYAMAVYEGIVQEVYTIKHWHSAGSTRYRTRRGLSDPSRWEFTGKPAPKRVRDRYILKSVENYLARGSQNPICYVGC